MNSKNLLSTLGQWGMLQIQIFLNTIKFYTRIPVPAWVSIDKKIVGKANIFLPVIGWIIGGISVSVFYLSSQVFNLEIAILLSLIAAAVSTGVIHENGFAHACEGLGEGTSRENIISIMRQSKLGTFGTMALILLMSMKFFSLEILDNQTLIWTIFIAHSLSRFVALSFNFTMSYIEDDSSINNPINTQIHQNDLLTSYIFAIFPLFLYAMITKNFFLFLTFPPLILVHLIFGYYFKKRLGGYSSECFGATQQISEVIIYLVIVAIST